MNEEKIMKANETEIQINPLSENKEAEKADPFSKGRERIQAIGNFFTRAKEKAAAITDRVKGGISRFLSKSKSLGMETAAGILSADELIKKGYEYTKDKVVAADEWMSDKTEEAGEYLGRKGAQAAAWTGEKATELKDWTSETVDAIGDKINEGGEWLENKGQQIGSFVGENYEKVAAFTKHKGEQIKQFANDKVELGKDITFYAKEKTTEGLAKAKEGVTKQYNKIKTFGENTLSAAKAEAARVKDSYREKMNAIRMRRLQAEFERVTKAESATSSRAEKLQQQKQILAEKLGLIQDLKEVAA